MKIFVKLGIVAAIITLFTFVACKKDETSQLTTNSGKSEEIVLTYRANTDKLEDLIQKSEDEYVTYINKSNVELCNVLKDLIIREDVNKFIVETAKANEGDVSYEELFGKFPELKPLFRNTIVGKRNKSNSLTTNSEEEYDFVYKDIAYKSMLFVPNEAVCKPSDKSILSPEIQIYKETGEGDIYFAWDVKKDKKEKEINIVEKEAMSTTVPMIVTSLKHVAFLKPVNLKKVNTNELHINEIENKKKLSPRGCCTESAWIREASVLYNYDGGTNIELYFTGVLISDNGQIRTWVRSGGSETWQASDHTQTCSLISTNSDNQFTNFNGPVGYDPNYWRDKKYFVNFYERDWGSSQKPLGSANYAGQLQYFSGRRQFTHEWYLYHPGRVQTFNDAVPMAYLYDNPGLPRYISGDADPDAPNNDCVSSSPYKNTGIKAEFKFTRGWY